MVSVRDVCSTLVLGFSVSSVFSQVDATLFVFFSNTEKKMNLTNLNVAKVKPKTREMSILGVTFKSILNQHKIVHLRSILQC